MAAAQDQAVTPRKRVLIVDDDDHVRKIHQDQLKSLGVESCFARNGKEAIDMISSDWSARTFDLILMARHMPLMDGILTTKELRTIEYPSLIYGVSHRLNEAEWEEFFSARPDDIYDEGKPLSIDTMKYIVGSIPTPKPCDEWRERVSRLPRQGIMTASQDQAVTPRKRVLIVDDDDHVRKIHEDQLKSLGVESCFARNGKEAIDMISSDWSARTFDLILMARHMPIMDGILTTMVLRTIEYPSLIYGVSHRLTEAEWEEFFRARPDDIYDEGKPLSIDTMKHIVESIPTPKPCDAWREKMSRLPRGPRQGKGYWYSCFFDQ